MLHFSLDGNGCLFSGLLCAGREKTQEEKAINHSIISYHKISVYLFYMRVGKTRYECFALHCAALRKRGLPAIYAETQPHWAEIHWTRAAQVIF